MTRVEAKIDRCQAAVGRPVDELISPALVVDRDLLRANISRMAARTAGATRLRPHAKTHKSAEVARLQLEAGAIGVTTQTVWEAAALAERGVEDILIANEVIGAEKVDRVAGLAAAVTLAVAVDDEQNLEDLSLAAQRAIGDIGVLVDVDVGMARCGVRSADEACALAGRAAALPGLVFRGVMGYEGHCVLERDRAQRTAKAEAAVGKLLSVAEAIERSGLPVEVVSAGGTGTFDITGAEPRVTELQAGSYVFMDMPYREIVDDFEIALTVLGTVVSRHDRTVVVDCGLKTVSADLGLPTLLGIEGVETRYVAEEHSVFDAAPDCPLAVGDRVRLATGHCCGTVNLHDVYYVVESGTVVDLWPVLARGSGKGTME